MKKYSTFVFKYFLFTGQMAERWFRKQFKFLLNFFRWKNCTVDHFKGRTLNLLDRIHKVNKVKHQASRFLATIYKLDVRPFVAFQIFNDFKEHKTSLTWCTSLYWSQLKMIVIQMVPFQGLWKLTRHTFTMLYYESDYVQNYWYLACGRVVVAHPRLMVSSVYSDFFHHIRP